MIRREEWLVTALDRMAEERRVNNIRARWIEKWRDTRHGRGWKRPRRRQSRRA